MKKSSFLAVFMVLAGAASAVAQPDGHAKHGGDGHGGPKHHFEQLDENKDGKVTRLELLAHAEARFNDADADKNGRVTRDEREVQHAKRKAAHFKKRDVNGDGKLSQQEVDKMPDEVFARHDSNGDKFLSQSELEAFELRAHFFHDADEDEDDGLTREAMRSHSEKRFGKLDKNGDGAITQDEMAKHGHGHHHSRGA